MEAHRNIAKVARALALAEKNEGNTSYQTRDYYNALKHYKKAIEALEGIPYSKQHHELLRACYLNCAAVYLAQKRGLMAIEVTEKVLNLPGELHNTKALFRMGDAYFICYHKNNDMKCLRKSRDVLINAYKSEPSAPIKDLLCSKVLPALGEQWSDVESELDDDSESTDWSGSSYSSSEYDSESASQTETETESESESEIEAGPRKYNQRLHAPPSPPSSLTAKGFKNRIQTPPPAPPAPGVWNPLAATSFASGSTSTAAPPPPAVWKGPKSFVSFASPKSGASKSNSSAELAKKRAEDLAAAHAKKEAGNKYYAMGGVQSYKLALQEYNSALTLTNDNVDGAHDLRRDCLLNASACSLMIADGQGALRYTQRVLQMKHENRNIKAILRQAKALMIINNRESLIRAKNELSSAYRWSTGNDKKAIKTALCEVLPKIGQTWEGFVLGDVVTYSSPEASSDSDSDSDGGQEAAKKNQKRATRNALRATRTSEMVKAQEAKAKQRKAEHKLHRKQVKEAHAKQLLEHQKQRELEKAQREEKRKNKTKISSELDAKIMTLRDDESFPLPSCRDFEYDDFVRKKHLNFDDLGFEKYLFEIEITEPPKNREKKKTKARKQKKRVTTEKKAVPQKGLVSTYLQETQGPTSGLASGAKFAVGPGGYYGQWEGYLIPENKRAPVVGGDQEYPEKLTVHPDLQNEIHGEHIHTYNDVILSSTGPDHVMSSNRHFSNISAETGVSKGVSSFTTTNNNISNSKNMFTVCSDLSQQYVSTNFSTFSMGTDAPTDSLSKTDSYSLHKPTTRYVALGSQGTA